jgi:hypothetical protein
LTNFSGDKKAWPVYITVGNLPADVRNAQNSRTTLLLALIPVPPKKGNLTREESNRVDMIVQQTLYDVLHPLEAVFQQGIEIHCGDGQIWRCYPRLSAWIADHMEYATLFGVKTNSYPQCETACEELGADELRAPVRDFAAYEELKNDAADGSDAHKAQVAEALSAVGVLHGRYALCSLYGACPQSLHKPDLLHGIYKGIFEDTLQWVTKFLVKHKRINSFDEVWYSLPAYPGFSPFHRSYTQITQWQGKELRNAVRVLNVTLAVALSLPSFMERPLFAQAQRCVFALVNFILMAQYRSHDDETISLMESYWRDFHAEKSIFLEFRPKKLAEQRSETYARRALKEAESVLDTGARRQRRMEKETAHIATEKQAIYNRYHGFNYVKFHLPLHYAEHIRRFGHVPGFSTDVGEMAHVQQIKNGYKKSNHVNAFRQILQYYNRLHQIKVRELNLIQLAKLAGDASGVSTVVTSLLPRQGMISHSLIFDPN